MDSASTQRDPNSPKTGDGIVQSINVLEEMLPDLMRLQNLDLLNVFKYRFFSLQLVSHKLLRWVIPFFMIVALVANLMLVQKNQFYIILALIQLLFYSLAVWGYFIREYNKFSRLLILPYFLVSSNISILFAWFYFLKGERYATWTPSRSE